MKSNPQSSGEWLLSARQDLARRRLAQISARRPLAGRVVPAGGSGEDPVEEQVFQEASLDAQLLLGHILGKPRAWIVTHPEAPLTSSQQARLAGLLDALMEGEPLPYLLGHWEFYGQDYEVTPDVLIPRPETELLVEQALAWLRLHPARRRAADVGTGSGCIAVTLASHAASLRIAAVDRSWAALQVARRNAQRIAIAGQIAFWQGDLLTAASGLFDLVCANLPYIPSGSVDNLPAAQYEPGLALDGGADGLELIRALLQDAPRWLAAGGLLLLEIQYDQGQQVKALAQTVFPNARLEVIHDLAGLPRLVRLENISPRTG